MLTHDLLRFTRRKGSVHPRQVDPNDKSLLVLGEELNGIYHSGVGQSMEEITELIQPVLSAFTQSIIAKGLHKLLLDRCRFQEADVAIEQRREKIFLAAAAQLRQDKMTDLPGFRQKVANTFQQDPDLLANQLFADLPPRRLLESFRPLAPARLLQRYNLAQAQGLLLHAQSLTVEIEEPDVGKRRKLFQYLKFYRLPATIRQVGEQRFQMEVIGPLAVIMQTRKYGMQLASLLPVICAMQRWSLGAVIRLPGETSLQFTMDETSGLRTHYTMIAQYRPEEFKIFAAQFRQEIATWELIEDPPILNPDGLELVAPDFSFRHLASQALVHLELFHPWHAAAILRRLEQLSRARPPVPLVVGVARPLTKSPEVRALLDHSSWFQAHGFEFNEFPPVKRVVKSLDSFGS